MATETSLLSHNMLFPKPNQSTIWFAEMYIANIYSGGSLVILNHCSSKVSKLRQPAAFLWLLCNQTWSF